MLHRLLVFLLLTFSASAADWTRLPDLLDAHGFAAPFAGVHRDHLLVAGGANFPGKKPWEGGAKVWHDRVFALDSLKPGGTWRRVGTLPRPTAYGVSFSLPEGLLCVGGSDATSHHRHVHLLQLSADGRVTTRDFPPLPAPRAHASGVLWGRRIVILGGTDTPEATHALASAWMLDLDAPDSGWQSLPDLPAPGRLLATAGVAGDSLYLVGGAALTAGPDGRPVRQWLRETLRFQKNTGWEKLADGPVVSVAAPQPMPALPSGALLLLGGDNGSQVTTPPTAHCGFPTTVFALDPATSAWSPAPVPPLPLGLVTTSAILWRDHLVIPGGEIRPGIRSTQIWALPLRTP